jgi:hypothetical protein
LGRIDPVRVFENASFGTGAVGMRNRREGGIEVSGVTGSVRAGFIYWAVITEGAPEEPVRSVLIRRPNPESAQFTKITGTPIGDGPTPCWRGNRTTVFKGEIPARLAIGNGYFRIELQLGANGSFDGEDPWVRSDPPLFEGISIVLIGEGSSTIALYDRNLAGNTFSPNLSYSLNLPRSVAGASRVLLHNIGADGQSGVSTTAFRQAARDVTRVGSSGIAVAGPNSPGNDSGWNGAVAGPLPQLWDNTVHDITGAVREDGTRRLLPVSVEAPDDCLVPVANLIAIEESAAP